MAPKNTNASATTQGTLALDTTIGFLEGVHGVVGLVPVPGLPPLLEALIGILKRVKVS